MRLRILKMVLWFMVGVTAMVAVARFVFGLGATTALNDTTPWGLWIGFDVMGGVALAAGGFVVAGTVYVFHLEKYRPILRPAVLTAFLGYVAVVVGLTFDLGAPWNIWRPVIHWQHHSALFEVAWCVILYLMVLALEFSPVVFENTRFQRLYRWLKKLTLPLVILGIMLSTLHQSSLGTLMVLTPYRLHPLWHSPMLPLLFLVSAVGLGLSMVMVESTVTAWVYERRGEPHLCRGLAKAASVVLVLYAVLRFVDLAARGSFHHVFDGSWESVLFLAEILVASLLPALIFAIPKARNTPAWLTVGAFMAVAGFVFNRINTSGIATASATGSDYFPSWMEVSVTLGIVAAAVLVFFFFVERYHVYEEPRATQPPAVPVADPVTQVRLSVPWSGDGRRYSLAFVIGVALALSLLPKSALEGARPRVTPAHQARVVDALRVSGQHGFDALTLNTSLPLSEVEKGEALLIDGNRDGRYVLFDYLAHEERSGGRDSCRHCHHANAPLSRASPCAVCHSDMYEPADTFDHTDHVGWTEGNTGCAQCHADSEQPKTRDTSTACLSCHQRMLVANSRVEVHREEFTGVAPGYMDAVHGLCIGCHQQSERLRPDLAPHLGRCATCHGSVEEEHLQRLEPRIVDPGVSGSEHAPEFSGLVETWEHTNH